MSLPASHHLEHPELHWWLHDTLRSHVRVWFPGGRDPRLVTGTDDDRPVLKVCINKDDTGRKPRDMAMDEMERSNGVAHVVAFDVWWKEKELDGGKNNKKKRRAKITKGFVAIPGDMGWFWDHVVSRVPPDSRTFYQILLPNASCAWYFDMDVDGLPHFDVSGFLRLLFEEMCTELREGGWSVDTLDIQPCHLWDATLLLDASSEDRSKISCHGVCATPLLVFADNHTAMKEFATRVKGRLSARYSEQGWGENVPLDLSVYSQYRCFRFYGNTKMTTPGVACRPLKRAAYNTSLSSSMLVPDEDRHLFLASVIQQGVPVTVTRKPITITIPDDDDHDVDLDALLGPRKSDVVYTYSGVVAGTARPSKPLLPPKDKEEEEHDDDDDNRPAKKPIVKFLGKIASQQNLAGFVNATKRPSVDKEAKEARRQQLKRDRDQADMDEKQRAEEQARDEADAAAAHVAEMMYKKRKQLEEEYFREHAIVHTGTENPTGFKVHIPSSSIAAAAAAWKDGVNLDEEDKKCDLTRYYRSDAFPLSTLVKLATHNSRFPLERVELGFVVNDSYWRNRRFGSGIHLKDFITLMKPQRMELGPVHPSTAIVKDSYNTLPLQKFLVFDCDMEDISEKHPDMYVRRCACRGSARVCGEGCWFYMRVAVKCLVYVLREIIGCRTIVPVYSGRRGVHVWVMDERFQTCSEEERSAIVERIKMIGDPARYYHGEYGPYVENLILRDEFYANFLDGPRLVCAPEIAQIVQQMIFEQQSNNDHQHRYQRLSEQIVEALVRTQMEANPALARREWQAFCTLMSSDDEEGLVPDFERRFIFRMMYPRLDAGVTIKHHHLVKFPFVVHPGSRRCAIPIPNIDTWTPDMAPRLSELLASAQDVQDEKEANNNNPNINSNNGWRRDQYAGGGGGGGGLKANPLDPYVDHFTRMLNIEYPLLGTFLQ